MTLSVDTPKFAMARSDATDLLLCLEDCWWPCIQDTYALHWHSARVFLDLMVLTTWTYDLIRLCDSAISKRDLVVHRVSMQLDVTIDACFGPTDVVVNGTWRYPSLVDEASEVADLERPVVLSHLEWCSFLRELTDPIARAVLHRGVEVFEADYELDGLLRIHAGAESG